MKKKKQIRVTARGPSEHLREQKIEDTQRISNILNQRTKKDKRNPFLKKNGSLNLVEKFVGIDYMPYERRIKKSKKR